MLHKHTLVREIGCDVRKYVNLFWLQSKFIFSDVLHMLGGTVNAVFKVNKKSLKGGIFVTHS